MVSFSSKNKKLLKKHIGRLDISSSVFLNNQAYCSLSSPTSIQIHELWGLRGSVRTQISIYYVVEDSINTFDFHKVSKINKHLWRKQHGFLV